MKADFSYFDWIQRLRQFIDAGKTAFPQAFVATLEIGPRASEQQVDETCKNLPVALPDALKRFWLQASGCCKFRYEWDVAKSSNALNADSSSRDDRTFGGGDFCCIFDLQENLAECRSWANETWIADEAEEFLTWQNALPIMALRNGDFLAVELEDEVDPRVVYLCHDDASQVIASSFTSFLETWAELCYIGPELWVLEPFLDAKSGFLSSDSERAKWLQKGVRP